MVLKNEGEDYFYKRNENSPEAKPVWSLYLNERVFPLGWTKQKGIPGSLHQRIFWSIYKIVYAGSFYAIKTKIDKSSISLGSIGPRRKIFQRPFQKHLFTTFFLPPLV
eukprot:XP_016662882.1 PREDICTED: uncharacterized protein LOC107884698 [Acyrthosiphon pisum]